MSGAWDANAESGGDRWTGWGRALDWLVALAPGFVWFIQLNVLYVLVPPSCRLGHPWFMVGTSVAAFGAAALATWASWRRRHDVDPSAYLPGQVGVLLGAFSLLVIALLGIAAVMGDPCR